MKTIVFRFDIDTHVCIRDGVPALIELADKHDVVFTFFINFGRSISVTQTLGLRQRSSTNSEHKAESMKAVSKLGLRDYIFLAMRNPKLSKYKKQIDLLFKSKHEIGLHGGKNHEIWASQAPLWTRERVNKEIYWGIKEYLKFSNNLPPRMFASPGWSTSENVDSALRDLNFSISGDKHSVTTNYKVEVDNHLFFLPTNLLAEPGGVAYFEHLLALGKTESEIVSDFFSEAETRETTVVYDHPYLAGKKGFNILDQIIHQALERGFRILPLSGLITE